VNGRKRPKHHPTLQGGLKIAILSFSVPTLSAPGANADGHAADQQPHFSIVPFNDLVAPVTDIRDVDPWQVFHAAP
jgi:hypothetical protein